MRKYYSVGNYYDMLFQSGKIRNEYRNFFKNDWVHLYITKTFVNLNFFKQYKKYYNYTGENYNESVIIPYLKLEKIRVNRWNGLASELEKEYVKMLSPNIPDSIRGEAKLILFDFYLEKGNIEKAIYILDSIPSSFPQFEFAQLKKILITDELPNSDFLYNYLKINSSKYAGLADLRKKVIFKLLEKNSDDISFVLNKVIKGINPEKCNVLNLVKFCIKNEKWIDCISLIDNAHKTKISFEEYGYLQFFRSKALVGKSNLKEAYENLITLDSLLKDYRKNELSEKELLISKIDSISLEWDSVGLKIDELMNKSQNAKVLVQIDSLKPAFEELSYKIKRYNELVRDAYKRKYDPFNLDVLHEEVKKLLKEFKNMDLKSEGPIEINSLQD